MGIFMSDKALTAGAENISKQLIQQLNITTSSLNMLRGKNGKRFYVLSGLFPPQDLLSQNLGGSMTLWHPK